VAKEKVLGYAATSVGQSLKPFEYLAPELGEHDIRVSVTHCGVCHTDIHAIEDYYGITDYPFVPGHEIAGLVTEMGPAVTELELGDRVGIGWQGRSCGKCEWCLKGEDQLCMDIVPAGTWVPYGGFSSSVIVDSRFAYLLPAGMQSQVAAVLMCAGITVYSPLRRHKAQGSLRMAVIGVGGLGHLAIQFAHALGYEVTAVSSSSDKRSQALAWGADYFLDSSDSKNLRQADYAFDMVLCTASGRLNWEAILKTLKKRGKLVLVGFPEVAVNPTDLVAHELSVTGSFLGTRAGMREMLIFANDKGIEPQLELMPMSRANQAIQRLKRNEARYRIVLVNETQ